MHIGSTKFLEEGPPEIEYNADGAICERCLGVDRRDNHEEEVVEEAINKDNDNEIPKQKVRQIRKEKEQVKRDIEREEIWQ